MWRGLVGRVDREKVWCVEGRRYGVYRHYRHCSGKAIFCMSVILYYGLYFYCRPSVRVCRSVWL